MILRKLNLAPRSALCFGIFCLMIVALGLLALRQAAQLNTAEKFIETNVLPSVKLLGSLDREFVGIRGNNARLRNPLEPQERRTKALSDIQQSRALIAGFSDALSKLIVTPQGRQAFDELSKANSDYQTAQDRYLASVAAGNLEAAVAISNGEMKSAADQVENTLKKLIGINDNKAEKAGDQAESAYQQTLWMVSIFIAAGVIATLLLAWMYTRSLTGPIGESLNIAQRIAANDLSKDIPQDGSDEAARLIAALALMQTNLRSALTLIGDSSTQLAATSEEMHAVTEDASRTIQRQSNEIEMAATAVNQMSAAVEEVASNAASASQVTSQSSTAAMAGRAQVDETVTAINLMVSKVQITSTEVQGLAVMATDISKVLDVIRAIAEQTNLLALNAAIEAARAGEAGRGFAVVADEVRALAHRTQQSTREIEQMVSSIQTGTGNAVTAMEQTSFQAHKTLEMANGAGKALLDITESISQINERNLMIATAAEEQAQVAREVDRSLVSIRDLSSQTSEGSNQTAIATAELSTLASGLNRLTKQFRV
ncbi:methyl-accepting chemotaxis protein [Pseudomonas syringae pv. tagetis]|uniref:Methyl-accepting chemotaxis protein n=2 Tax=Pseudomonas syringae group genomosp. 7 TaxID=251699 RepID=A0A0Q0ENW7_9PSED|nr:methyl-accepting chemotaxis protein [Pseudomonas syringae group genomosp. 7]KPX47327.1 Methyl-accepting chemotaxis protein [Pseudomonas syringae pv. helianthi]KPY88189.1 Methyl-accepting chemotaxis protein [Pseudomonas syringae pv. tagetis]RMR01478.1 Methyl-accepting chemotaxis protein [Pseudomonas syringae pv. helianthi]RMV42437.1 Methyl-accepting chemotaxis protein [Pseudomonas syringae pv. helianthi]RMW17229.1 Methyl-accepting chemotaxis protein [Pseudomonas syringae pv. tagetis]